MDRRFDEYEITFGRGDESAFSEEISLMEKNSEWVKGISSNGITMEAIDGPMFAEETAHKYNLDYALTVETASEGVDRCGTHLVANTGVRHELVRDTARSSLCETAKLFGSALGRMPPYLFAETINNGLSVARGSTLMLIRYGKASAFHSDSEGGYQVMPISKLLDITTSMIDRRFGTRDFIEGYNCHGYTYASWNVPDVQDRLLLMYQRALGNTKSKYPINFMPGIRFASSDTAASCATLYPVFFIPKTNAAIHFVDGVQIKHTKRGKNGTSAIELFQAGAESLFAKFEASAEVIEKLASIDIEHGCNAVVSLCNKFRIAKKYGEAARAEMERLTAGDQPVNAHDLYLCMTEAIAEAQRLDARESVINTIEESIAKILTVDWNEHDVGGTVCWA